MNMFNVVCVNCNYLATSTIGFKKNAVRNWLGPRRAIPDTQIPRYSIVLNSYKLLARCLHVSS